MRIKALIFFSVLFCYGSLFSQEKLLPDNKLYLKLFQEFRITPIDVGYDFSTIPYVPVFLSRDDHLTGFSYGMALGYIIQKSRIAFSLSNSFRYDHIYYNSDVHHSVLKNVKGFMADVHFDFNKFIRVRKNHIQLGVGFSWMNIGSEYSYLEYFQMPNGDSAYYTSTDDLRLNSFNFLLGYQTGRISMELINRFTLRQKFSNRGNIIMPAIRIGYSIGLKNDRILQP